MIDLTREIQFKTTRSGGKGGQNVNKVETAVIGSWLVDASMMFNDDQKGVMNLSLKETGGDILLISQFTLHASTKKGNRPSYIRASKPPVAVPLYEKMITYLGNDLGKPIKAGIFGADMKVELLNDGPVTIWIDSRNKE